jgi:dihydrofolate reductase
MTLVTCHISVSLDGFAAGPNQTPENPLGERGERLHEWAFANAAWREQHGREGGERSPDAEVTEEVTAGVGAYVMGRNMFAGPGDGPWDEAWRGWWGEDPPFHVPVFVLTHHPREPLAMDGGTTFHFVDGVEPALAAASAAAGSDAVMVAGGAQTVRQVLRAGRLDELYLHIAPVLLGAGERLLEDVGDPVLEPVKVVASPLATHVKYRVTYARD